MFRFILFSPLLLAACNVSKNFQEQIIYDFSGTWVSNSEGMRFEETWLSNENKLLGKGIICIDSDTLFKERLVITKRYGKWCYGAAIENQNDGETIFFKLKDETGQGEYIFCNKRHDFPRTLLYRFNSDTLYIQIEGIDNGAFKSEEIKLFKSPMRVL